MEQMIYTVQCNRAKKLLWGVTANHIKITSVRKCREEAWGWLCCCELLSILENSKLTVSVQKGANSKWIEFQIPSIS